MTDNMSDFYAKMEELQYQDVDATKNESDFFSKIPELCCDQEPEIQEKELDATFWKNINNKGFLVYECDHALCLQKFPTPLDQRTIQAEEYSCMQDIVDRISELLSSIMHKFKITFMYNKGFGSEYEEINLDALDVADAQTEAIKIIKNKIKDLDFEIKINQTQ